MKHEEWRKCKELLCKTALAAALLFGALTVSAMAQGTLGLLAGAGLLLAELLVLNTVCGALLPAAAAPTAAQMARAARELPLSPAPVLRVVRGGGGDRVA